MNAIVAENDSESAKQRHFWDSRAGYSLPAVVHVTVSALYYADNTLLQAMQHQAALCFDCFHDYRDRSRSYTRLCAKQTTAPDSVV